MATNAKAIAPDRRMRFGQWRGSLSRERRAISYFYGGLGSATISASRLGKKSRSGRGVLRQFRTGHVKRIAIEHVGLTPSEY